MTQILERLVSFGEFEVVYFGDECILNTPVEAWPLCDWCARTRGRRSLQTPSLHSRPHTHTHTHAPIHPSKQPHLFLQRRLPAGEG
jgi:hypothetical protein